MPLGRTRLSRRQKRTRILRAPIERIIGQIARLPADFLRLEWPACVFRPGTLALLQAVKFRDQPIKPPFVPDALKVADKREDVGDGIRLVLREKVPDALRPVQSVVAPNSTLDQFVQALQRIVDLENPATCLVTQQVGSDRIETHFGYIHPGALLEMFDEFSEGHREWLGFVGKLLVSRRPRRVPKQNLSPRCRRLRRSFRYKEFSLIVLMMDQAHPITRRAAWMTSS